MHVLPETGYLRLCQIIGDSKATPPIPAIIPVSRSTWWSGVKSGRYPQPVRTLGSRITAWRVEDIRTLIQQSSGCRCVMTNKTTDCHGITELLEDIAYAVKNVIDRGNIADPVIMERLETLLPNIHRTADDVRDREAAPP